MASFTFWHTWSFPVSHITFLVFTQRMKSDFGPIQGQGSRIYLL
jgi:hypothetical protein